MTRNPAPEPATPATDTGTVSEPVPPVMPANRQQMRPVWVALAASVAVYANILGNQFVWDDNLQIARNPFLRQWKYLGKAFSTPVWSFMSPQRMVLSNYYRPLQAVAYTLVYHLGGLTPWCYHVVSILFHALATVAVLLLAGELTGNAGLALATALLFAVDPIHTEAVSWIAGLPDLQCAVFYLFGFYAWLRWRKTLAGTREAKKWLLAACAAYFLALLSKEMGATLPLAILIYERFFGGAGSPLAARQPENPTATLSASGVGAGLKRGSGVPDDFTGPAPTNAASLTGLRRTQALGLSQDASATRVDENSDIRVRRLALGMIGMAAALAAYLGLRFWALGGLSRVTNGYELTRGQYVLSVLALVGGYFQKVFLPVRLNFYYVFRPTTSLRDPHMLLGAAWVILCLLALWLARRWPHPVRLALFGIVWILATLVPVLAIRQLGFNVFTERYLYLPSMGACLAVAALLWELYARPSKAWRSAAVGAWLAIVLLFAAQTVRRNRDWKDDIALSVATSRASPGAAPIYNILSRAYFRRGEYPQALHAAEHALEAASSEHQQNHISIADAYAGMGSADLAMGKAAEAEDAFHRALDYYPNQDAFLNLGVIAFHHDDYKTAFSLSVRAIHALPVYDLAYNNAGAALLAMGQAKQAIPYFQQAVELSPRYSQARINLAVAYHLTGKNLSAAEQLRAVIEYDPQNQKATELLGSLLRLPEIPAPAPR